MIILALSGWKQSGKDLMADYLVKHYSFERVSFADPLKEMVAKEFNIPLDFLHSTEFKEKALEMYPVESTDAFIKNLHNFMVAEFRTLDGAIPDRLENIDNQTYGLIKTYDLKTDSHTANYQKVYWTPRALAIYKGSGNRSVDANYWTKTLFNKMNDPFGYYVVPDLRFKTEMQQLKDRFKNDVIFVRIKRFDSVFSTDPSERDLDNENFDYTINNLLSEQTSKDQYFNKIDNVLEHIRRCRLGVLND